MVIIPQKQLFGWEEIEALGELERLRLVAKHLPDERLMRTLERRRAKGRDDYPVRAVWNSILAGVVYQHPSIESLRRELLRNAQLRQLCGFDVFRGGDAVPPPWVYTRFLKRLMECAGLIDAMFEELVDALRRVLPDFGKTLAVDGKAIQTHARPRHSRPMPPIADNGKAIQTHARPRPKDAPAPNPDGRRDVEANFGAKRRNLLRKDGTLYEKVKYWFGYKLHLVVDSAYELPVARTVTPASRAEQPEAHRLLTHLGECHPKLLKTCETWPADKGYDDRKLLMRLWDHHEIRPVIPIRNNRPSDEPTRRVSHLRHVVYNREGRVYCYPHRGEPKPMAFAGFEKDRRTLKFRCPARHYGISCPDLGRCPSCVRIPLAEDRRVFLPLARSTYQWERVYKKRTAVERVNGRLDVSFGFENHFIRWIAKMRLRIDLALIIMLAMALGRVKEKRPDKLRSLVQAA